MTKPLELICTSVLVENHICKLCDIASQQNGTQHLLISVCVNLNGRLSKHNTKEMRQCTITSWRRQGKAIHADLACLWNACSESMEFATKKIWWSWKLYEDTTWLRYTEIGKGMLAFSNWHSQARYINKNAFKFYHPSLHQSKLLSHLEWELPR